MKNFLNSSWFTTIKSTWSAWLVLCIALLFYPLRGAVVTIDSTFYMASAVNLSQGLGYLDADWTPITIRGPMFPAILALGFQILGQSVESAMYILRLFFIGNLLAVYWLGKQFMNRYVGLIAAIFILTSSTIHFWSSRIHLDHVMPFFILLSNLILFIGIKRERTIYYAAAGLILGLGFLVKDVAGLFVITPAILWLIYKPYRQRKNITPIFIYMLLFSCLALPWLFYATIYGENNYFATLVGWIFTTGIQPTAATAAPAANVITPSDANSTHFLYTLVTTIVTRFIKYYELYYAENFSIAPLFLIAWSYVVYRAIRYRQLAETFLTLLLFLFTPIMLFLAETEYRAGQTVYTYILSYLALAYALSHIPLPFQRKVNYRMTIISAVFFVQLFSEPSAFIHLLRNYDSYGFVGQANIHTFSFWQSREFSTRGADTDVVRDSAKWLRTHVSPEEVILADSQWLDPLYFYLEGRQPIYEIEYVSSQVQRNVQLASRSDPRFIWTQAGRTDPSKALSHLWAFSEQNFLNQINELEAKFVIIGVRRSFLTLYLNTHPDFVPAAYFENGRIQIYEIRPNANLEALTRFPLFISTNLDTYLDNLRSQRTPDQYQQFRQEYFLEELSLPESTLQKIEASSLPTFPHVRIISHERFAQMLQQNHPDLLLQVIATYEEQAIENSENPWLYLTLAYLYQASKQYELIPSAFTQALSQANDTSVIHASLIETYQKLNAHLMTDSTISEQLINISKEFLEKAPNDIEGYWRLAESYQLLGQWDEAHRVYDQIFALWPQSAGTMFRMAKLYQSQGDYEQARKAYATLINLPPDEQNLPTPAEIHIEVSRMLLSEVQGVTQ